MSMLHATRPMIANPASFRVADPRHVGLFLRVISVCLLAASIFAQDPIAYLLVTIPVLVPSYLWVASGAFGIPVLPVVAALFYLYYAMPLLIGSALKTYRPEELLWATFSVGLFLMSASVVAWPFVVNAHKRTNPARKIATSRRVQMIRAKSLGKLASNDELFRLIFVGLAAGNLYYLALASGYASYLGTSIGVVRAVCVTLASAACYLLGFARGVGVLSGPRWALALAGFFLLTILSISNLLLVGGALNMAAALLGYTLAAKRIPWIVLGSAFALLSILNAGKFNMRNVYWAPESQVVQNTSIFGVPDMMANWLVSGVSGSALAGASSGSLLERTSLLHMVLVVQDATPAIIPYLEGETYALLPSMLTPRFLNPEKLESQAGLNLLSVRYGRERAEDTYKTTIGWGLVAEAYANFGNPGVIGIGMAFGLLCGILMRLSATAAPVSLVMLVTISSALTLCNLEMDFSSLAMSLLQTAGGILLFALLPRFVNRRSAPVVPQRRKLPERILAAERNPMNTSDNARF
jgi:hypothetical protein